jgi:hypothetical protein
LTLPVCSVPEVVESLEPEKDAPPPLAKEAVIVRGPFAGRCVRITAINGDSAEVELRESNDPTGFIDILKTEEQNWISLSDFFQQLPIDPDNGRAFLSSLRVKFKGDASHSEQFVDFAFTAFSQKRVLDGCCRKRGRDYDVTTQFLSSCRTYLQQPCVGKLHQILRQPTDSESLRVTPDMLYGDRATGQLLHDLNVYIERHLLARRFFLIDEEICHISQVTLEKMESFVLQHFAGNRKLNWTGEKLTLPLADLVWIGKAKPTATTKAKIGARVVNIASVGSIDFGEPGTVVATFHEHNLYYVMLDKMATWATTLRGRLQSKRGYIAKADDLIFVGQQ